MAESDVQVDVRSIYGHKTRKGLVQVQIGTQEWIWTPAEARRVSRLLLEAAEGADTDEFLMEQFIAVVGLSDQAAAQVLREFRAARKAKYGDLLGTPEVPHG